MHIPLDVTLPARSRLRPHFCQWACSGTLFSSFCLGVLILSTSVLAADWPYYRGPNHDGTSPDPIRSNWSEQAPRQVWKVPLQPALSSFSVSGGRAFTQARRNTGGGEREFCVALNADTGQEIWAVALDIADYPNGGVGSDDGPRSTPSVDGNQVYVLTSYLRLFCLDAATGQEAWSKDLKSDYGAYVIPWQNAASPLIEGDMVLVNSNGRQNEHLLAFRKQDGNLVWKGQSDGMTQASPVAATIGGTRQAIFFAQSGLVSVAPETGRVLWRHPLRYNGTSVAASPVVVGDTVYGSRGYPSSPALAQAGAVVVKIETSGSGFSANPAWSKVNQLMNHWATPVHHNGHLYGMFGHGFLQLKCVELATGNEKWSADGFGYGSVLVVDGKILAASEDGQLVLLDPNPNAYTELARYRALQGKTWNVPAISGGRIYFRSTTEAVCLDVAAAVQPRPDVQLAWVAPAPIVFGASLSSAQLNASATVPGSFAYTPAIGTVLSAGNHTLSVTFTPNDTANYAPATASVTLSVLKADQTITFNPLSDRRLTDPPVTLNATATSGLPVSFTVSGPATLSGQTLTMNGLGTVTVMATQPGNADYNAAPSVQRQFVVLDNPALSLVQIADQTIDEGSTLSLLIRAENSDPPARTLTYSLTGSIPAGATLQPGTGAFAWTPTEAQGPATYNFTVQATDNADPNATARRRFSVTVNEVNTPPTVLPIPFQTVAEGKRLEFIVAASDSDVPPNQVFYLLGPEAPAGANIDPILGEFTWTPTESQGPSTNAITVLVKDDGNPSQSFTTNIMVIVTEVNTPPRLGILGDQIVTVGETVSVAASGSDSDLPAQKLTFSLEAGPPAGASINAGTGAFAWTPTPAQAPSTNQITVRVTDDGTPALSESRTFSVLVRAPPNQLPSISDLRFDPVAGLRFKVSVPDGKQARLQMSVDLINWVDLAQAPLRGTSDLQDAQSPGLSSRFYRLLVE
ncbi:MAG: PQQ-binding-like beta-propeller repeat protein [Verrucomicrobia bacterium]|nr:PQQ-binding-like beta-propeller repeat protein [Verrucomicrobiota bacterium]